jgi:glycosyltransferase involved in cell wall biosynthesis
VHTPARTGSNPKQASDSIQRLRREVFITLEQLAMQLEPVLVPAITPIPVRVGYDAQALVSEDGGTGKGLHLRNLITSRWAEFEGYAPAGNKKEITGVLQGGSSRYLIWQQTSLPRWLSTYKPEVFLAPYNTAPIWLPRTTRLVLVLHDLIAMQKFQHDTLKKTVVNSYKRLLITPSVAQASYVLTVSEYSRRQILELFPEARVIVIPCTIPASWFELDASVSMRPSANYILLVTAAAPHKNTARALRAYASYVKHAGAGAANLRIVGLSQSGSQFRSMVSDLGVTNRVVFEPLVATATLQELYRGATAVLFPSLLEGFGIPVLEAMASGTPVVTSRGSSLSEVGGEAARYCDPFEETSIVEALLEVVRNANLREQMVRRGRVQAAKFHPDSVRPRVDSFWRRISSEHSRNACHRHGADFHEDCKSNGGRVSATH